MFLHCPPPQTEGTHPYFKWPFGRCFLFQSEKKTYQWSQLGKIDPKDYRNKGVSLEPMGNWTQFVLHVLYCLVWASTCFERKKTGAVHR